MTKNHIQLVLITVPDKETATGVARELVKKRLAACVNIVPQIDSIYRWEGKIQTDTELLLLVKTSPDCYAKLEETVLSLHPYDTPEIISVDIASGLAKYCSWVVHETSSVIGS